MLNIPVSKFYKGGPQIPSTSLRDCRVCDNEQAHFTGAHRSSAPAPSAPSAPSAVDGASSSGAEVANLARSNKRLPDSTCDGDLLPKRQKADYTTSGKNAPVDSDGAPSRSICGENTTDNPVVASADNPSASLGGLSNSGDSISTQALPGLNHPDIPNPLPPSFQSVSGQQGTTSPTFDPFNVLPHTERRNLPRDIKQALDKFHPDLSPKFDELVASLDGRGNDNQTQVEFVANDIIVHQPTMPLTASTPGSIGAYFDTPLGGAS